MKRAALVVCSSVLLLVAATSASAADWSVRASYGTTTPETARLQANVPTRLRIPLGLPVRLALTRAVSGRQTAAVTAFKVSNHKVTKPLFNESVSPDLAVLDYPAEKGTERVLFGIHLGTATLTANPPGPGPDHTFLVEVMRPVTLGAAPWQYDKYIVEMAHKGGMPPSVLKRQIQRETNFNPMSYRYEPLSPGADFAAITAVGDSSGKNVRAVHPFERYRLATLADATNEALPSGRDLTAADLAIAAAARLKIRKANGAIDLMTAQDRFVSARNIYENNDARQNWSKSNPRWAAKVKVNPELLDFTAQTGLAASYGLMQIMYPTAISLMHWKDADRAGNHPAVNPSLLFDTPENLASGNGSMSLGAEYAAEQYLRAHGDQLPPHGSVDDFVGSWFPALNFYNHGTSGCKADVCSGNPSCYGRCIIDDHAKYLPLVAGKVIR